MSAASSLTWDLSDLYKGIDDPAIDRTLNECLERAKEFARRYRGNINRADLTPEYLHTAVQEFEALAQEMAKPMAYASLVFCADTSKPEHGALLQKVQERESEITLELIPFELELMELPPEVIDPILAAPILAKYRHFIHKTRLFRDHKLSEPEERILEQKANTGCRAFQRLFEESVSAIQFRVVVEGEERVLTEPEVIALLRDPNRETRKAAAAALSKGLQENSRLLTFIFNTLVYDKAIDDRLRRYEYPEQSRHMANELDDQTVETVVAACVEGFDITARYYSLKREILGYDKLYHYDRYAPLFESKKRYPFEEGKEIVLNSFERFSPLIRQIAQEFFENRWIDAEPRPGKRGGAFCSYVTADLHPYVFMSYLERSDDVMTLAHELGHGVHAYLAREQGFLNMSSALPVAELASTFGQMLVFEALADQADLEEKLALYAEKIEEVFATVQRQAAMYRFEQELHRARRSHGELTSEHIGELWQKNMQAMFRDSLELGEEHSCWWMYVSHFVESPFYVYAYSFGELLVMALYSMYKDQGAAFVPKYIDLLRTGGSCSPQELLSRIGVDIKDPEFWRGGIRVMAQMVDEFERLYRSQRGKTA
ncbi:MAG: M3 family oligoendopeptidase [Armatimonadota bacterium]|nr:M3 family oligoendopeptidase [Armatimonadota bacterium]